MIKADEIERQPDTAEKTYFEQLGTLLITGYHADVVFKVGEECIEIKAHRAILSARSQYFNAMLGEDNQMCESVQGVIRTMHDAPTFQRMLEFIYTNDVKNIENCSATELISLLILANEYLLDDLRKLCERNCTGIISLDNIGKLLLLSAGHNASELRIACSQFVCDHKQLLAQDPAFRQDIELNPELGLLLFESSLAKIPGCIDDYDISSSNNIGNRYSSHGGNDSNGYNNVSYSGSKRRRVAENNSENELDFVPVHHATTLTNDNVLNSANNNNDINSAVTTINNGTIGGVSPTALRAAARLIMRGGSVPTGVTTNQQSSSSGTAALTVAPSIEGSSSSSSGSSLLVAGSSYNQQQLNAHIAAAMHNYHFNTNNNTSSMPTAAIPMHAMIANITTDNNNNSSSSIRSNGSNSNTTSTTTVNNFSVVGAMTNTIGGSQDVVTYYNNPLNNSSQSSSNGSRNSNNNTNSSNYMNINNSSQENEE